MTLYGRAQLVPVDALRKDCSVLALLVRALRLRLIRVFDARLAQYCWVKKPGMSRVAGTSYNRGSMLFFANISQLQYTVAFWTSAFNFGEKNIAGFVRLDSEKMRQPCEAMATKAHAY